MLRFVRKLLLPVKCSKGLGIGGWVVKDYQYNALFKATTTPDKFFC